jgi:hypothetical protein
MATTATSGHNPHNDDPKGGAVAIHISHVRLSIAQTSTTNPVPIPSIMHKIMNKIRDIDNNAIFHDILDKPVSLEQFPVEKDAFDTAFGTIVPDRRNSQVIVSLTIHSTMNFGSIRSISALSDLPSCRLYATSIHSCAPTTVPLGPASMRF